uniref:Uncharacterized protein n=1 Tax=Arundo donax TaxID=35708 RepID=A0A0A8ZFV2_ARUDO
MIQYIFLSHLWSGQAHACPLPLSSIYYMICPQDLPLRSSIFAELGNAFTSLTLIAHSF